MFNFFKYFLAGRNLKITTFVFLEKVTLKTIKLEPHLSLICWQIKKLK